MDTSEGRRRMGPIHNPGEALIARRDAAMLRRGRSGKTLRGGDIR